MGQLVVRTSDRNTFRQCRQLWDWSSPLRQNLEPAERYAPFEDGSSWHAAMEVYYNPVTWHLLQDPLTAEAVRHSARERLLAVHEEQRRRAVELQGSESLPVETEEDYKERKRRLLGMLGHYFTWAPKHDHFTPKFVEVEFEVPIIGPFGDPLIVSYNYRQPAVYQGRLDGLVADPAGDYWILEHKTTGQMGRTDHLELDSQCGSYAWAIQTQLGIRIKGIIYTQVLKDFPTPPDRLVQQRKGRWFSVNKQQRTTYEVYLDTLEKDGEDPGKYADFLQYLKEKGNPFVRRLDIHRNQHSLEYVGQNIYKEATEMLGDPNIYPNPSYFNCNGCRFREPCIAKQNGYDHEFILKELFVERS